MKRTFKLLIVIFMLFFISGCGKEKYVTFSYDDNKTSDYKCKITDGKLDCDVVEPEKEDLPFDGWYDEQGNEVDINGEFKEEVTLHPKFLTEEEFKEEKLSEKKYIITFDMNGGLGSISKIEVEYDAQLPNVLNIPKRSEYIFKGFFDNKDYTKGKQYYNENGESVKNFDKVNNTILYAGWEKEVRNYTIIFKANGGTGKMEPQNITRGGSAQLISNEFKRAGYTFSGWNVMSSGEGLSYKNNDVITPVSNMTLYAQWTTSEYTVSFNANGGSGKVPYNVSLTYGKEMPSINGIPTKDGYTFMGWYDSSDYTKGNQYYTKDNKSAKNYDKTSDITLYAGWEKKATKKEKYKVTFDLNGGIGTKPSDVKVTNGKEMPNIETEIPTRKGYNFVGWYDNKDYTKGTRYYTKENKSAINYNKKESITLYAGWEKKEAKAQTYTITFVSNGGTGKMNSQNITVGSSVPLIANTFKKTGYTFAGWNTMANGEGASFKDNETVTPGENVTLYAMWKVIEYTVTFDANSGSGKVPYNVSVAYGSDMPSISAEVMKEGYNFIGWYDNTDWTKGTEYYTKDNKSARKFDKTSNITLYAAWEKRAEKTYKVVFNLNGGTGTKPEDVKVTNGKDMPSITKIIPTRSGYAFMGWYDTTNYTKGTKYYTEENKSAKKYDKTESITLYAGWEANKYTLTFDANGGKGGQSKNVSVTYGREMPKIDTASPTRSGYTFMGWYDGKDYTNAIQYYTKENTSTRNYDKTKNITLYAGWSKNQTTTVTYTVSFDANGGKGGQSADVTVTNGKPMPQIDTTAPTRTGYTFMGWYDTTNYANGTMYYDANGAIVNNYDKTSNITLYAGWSANKFTIEYNGNGGTGSVASQTCTYDKDCKLAANGFTKEGYTFAGWKKNNEGNIVAAGTNVKNIISSGKVTYYAEWSGVKYTISFDLNNGTGTAPSNISVSYGSVMPKLNSIAPTRVGYTFMGWYDNSDYTKGTEYYNSKGESTVTFNKTTNVKLYAGWKLDVYIVTFNLNGGTGTAPSNVSISYNSAMPKLSVASPTRNGYTFMGWYDNTDWSNGSATKYYNADGTSAHTYNKTSNIRLYAGWKEIPKTETTYTVSFNANGGTGGQTANVTATNGKEMPKISTTAPTREGYTFMGWYDGKDYNNSKQYYNEKGTSVRNFDIKANLTLYAGWLDNNKFIIKYDCNGGSNPPADQTIKNGDIFSPQANTCTRAGYTFNGWYTKASEGSDWTFNVHRANFNSKSYKNNIVQLYAQWDPELKTNTIIKPDDSKYKYAGKCTDLRSSNIKNMQIGQYCSYESDTLKYYIIKQDRYIITYVWAKDAYKQFKMGVPAEDPKPSSSRKNDNYGGNKKILYYNWLGKNIMENEIKQNGYEKKGLIGFNASAMIAQQWVTDSLDQNVPTGWYGQTHINIFRVNGETIRASYDKYRYNTLIYGLGNDGNLKSYKTNFGSDSDIYIKGNDLVKKYIEDVYEIKNTFGFSPVLVKNGKKVVDNNKSNMREAICQKDKNNFAFITSTSTDRENGLSYNDLANMMVDMGCQTGLNLDGGGSTSYFYKSNIVKSNNTEAGLLGDSSGTDLVGPGDQHGVAYKCPTCTEKEKRVSADIIYFVEQ